MEEWRERGTSGTCLCDLQFAAISGVERSSAALHVLWGMMIAVAFTEHMLDAKHSSRTLIIIAHQLLPCGECSLWVGPGARHSRSLTASSSHSASLRRVSFSPPHR